MIDLPEPCRRLLLHLERAEESGTDEHGRPRLGSGGPVRESDLADELAGDALRVAVAHGWVAVATGVSGRELLVGVDDPDRTSEWSRAVALTDAGRVALAEERLTPAEQPRWVTVADAAIEHGVNQQKVRRLANRRKAPIAHCWDPAGGYGMLVNSNDVGRVLAAEKAGETRRNPDK